MDTSDTAKPAGDQHDKQPATYPGGPYPGGFGLPIPFAAYLGLYLVSQSREKAVVRVPGRPELQNSWGVANGGVIMTLHDIAMGSSVRGWVGEPVSVLTVDISMNFLNPAKGDIIATGRVLRGGKSLLFCESEAHDTEGNLLSKAMATVKYMPFKPAPGSA